MDIMDSSDVDDDTLPTAVSRRRSDIQSILSDDLNKLKCEDKHLQSTLQKLLDDSKNRKEDILIIQDTEDIENGVSLMRYLEKYGPFPLNEGLSSRILKDIAHSLVFLHRNKLSAGILNLSTVILDKRMRAHIVAGPHLQEAKTLDDKGEVKDCLAEDMFRLGFILYRLVTGLQPQFKENTLLPLPHRSFNISPTAKVLSELLMSQFTHMRPKAGDVVFNKWAEQAALLPEPRIIGVYETGEEL